MRNFRWLRALIQQAGIKLSSEGNRSERKAGSRRMRIKSSYSFA